MFGGISPHLSHLGTIPAIATPKNAVAAMAYDKAIRAVIETSSRKRIADEHHKKPIHMLEEERDAAKKATLRDIAAQNDTRNPTKPAVKAALKSDPPRYKGTRNKGGGGKVKKRTTNAGINTTGTTMMGTQTREIQDAQLLVAYGQGFRWLEPERPHAVLATRAGR